MIETPIAKIPVTERAIIQRINRKLKDQDRRLQACRRNSRWWHTLGDFYVVDVGMNAIVETNIDTAKYAGKLGVIKPFEVIA